MQFEFTTVAKIIFGTGKLNSIGDVIGGMGDRALVISGAPHEITNRLLHLLELHGITNDIMEIDSEPTVEVVRNAIAFARQILPELVIAIGGGSAIDTGKATAALLANSGDVTDYLEVIGLNKSLANPSLPLVAIPTTAGTGSEVTRNAVIGSPGYHVKVSLRSHFLFPKVALVDPELTMGVPPEITAYTGLDALTQLIEPLTCINPNPLSDALCKEGIQLIAHSLYQAYNDGKNIAAREGMSVASLFSGLSLANAKLGAVHGLAGTIGGEIPAHHGAICASLLPAVMDANVNALCRHSPDHPALARYTMIGRLLTGDVAATSDTAIQWVGDICQYMNIPPLSKLGLLKDQFPAIIEKAKESSSMKGNPITLSDDELRSILQRSL